MSSLLGMAGIEAFSQGLGQAITAQQQRGLLGRDPYERNYEITTPKIKVIKTFKDELQNDVDNWLSDVDI